MRTARPWKTGSSLSWNFCWIDFTASASMRAWAGSYTPQGRSQWACAGVGSDRWSASERRRARMRIAKLLVGGAIGFTLVRAISLRTTRVAVKGDSMEPALAADDRLLVRRTQRPRRGDVVALRDPRDGARVLVKRVAELNDDGVVVVGENPDASTDSRTFGPVSRASLIRVAVYRYAPLERTTRLRRRPVPSTAWPPTGSMPSWPPTTSRG